VVGGNDDKKRARCGFRLAAPRAPMTNRIHRQTKTIRETPWLGRRRFLRGMAARENFSKIAYMPVSAENASFASYLSSLQSG
jgi:hypothetical protein